MKIRAIKYRGNQNIGFTKFRKQVMFRVKDIVDIIGIETKNYLKIEQEIIVINNLSFDLKLISENELTNTLEKLNNKKVAEFKKWLNKNLPLIKAIAINQLPKLIIYQNKLCIQGGWLNNNCIMSKQNLDALLRRNQVYRVRRACKGTPLLIEYNSLPKRFKDKIEMLYPDFKDKLIKTLFSHFDELEPQTNQTTTNTISKNKTFDLMSDIIQIENHDLRVAITQKLLA